MLTASLDASDEQYNQRRHQSEPLADSFTPRDSRIHAMLQLGHSIPTHRLLLASDVGGICLSLSTCTNLRFLLFVVVSPCKNQSPGLENHPSTSLPPHLLSPTRRKSLIASVTIRSLRARPTRPHHLKEGLLGQQDFDCQGARRPVTPLQAPNINRGRPVCGGQNKGLD